MAIVVRYPGRACLLGEHCDWAGGASVAVPLPMGVEVTAEAGERGLRARSDLEGRLVEGRWPLAGAVEPTGGPLRFVGAAAAALADRGLRLPPTELWIRSDLPAGRGFSSSAALSLALLDALARRCGEALDAQALADLAYELEHDRLGVSCGRLDPLACAAGAPVFLRWQDGRAPLRRLSIGARLHLLVGALPRPRDTAGILAALHRAFHSESGPATTAARRLVLTLGHEAEAGALALQRGDLPALGAAMNRTQEAYTLAIPHIPALRAPGLLAACATLRERGALGAKFSGAGGDGSVIGIFDSHDHARAACAPLEDAGLSTWTLTLEQP